MLLQAQEVASWIWAMLRELYSDDIESDYAYCVKNGYKIVTDGIEGIAGFWDNGIRYFKIASPTGEQFEVC